MFYLKRSVNLVFLVIIMASVVYAAKPPEDLDCCRDFIAGYPGITSCGEDNLNRNQCQKLIDDWEKSTLNPYGGIEEHILIAVGLCFIVIFYVWHRSHRKRSYDFL